MKKFTLLLSLSIILFSCGHNNDAYNQVKILVETQTSDLVNVETIKELIDVQQKNGDQFIELMTFIEPELTSSQLEKLNAIQQKYNNTLRKTADSLAYIELMELTKHKDSL